MILLIGGLGNVGRNLETHFKRTTDQDVFVLGRKPEHIVKKLYPDINYIEQDLLSDGDWELEKYINNNDFNLIINLAFSLGNFANTVIKNNKLIMDNLLNNAKHFDEVVHISTTAVGGYGSKPSDKIVNNYSWDDFYTLAKSVQENYIFKNDISTRVIRIGNFMGNDSIFLKSLALLTQIKISKDDFDFLSDITTTYDIANELLTASELKVNNLYNKDLTTWLDLISFTKSNWEISAELSYNYDKAVSFTDYKKLLRYFSYLIPKNSQTNLENFIKKSTFLTRNLQSTISNLESTTSIFRVKRDKEQILKKSLSKNIKDYLTRLDENAKSFRLK
jgi:nucleoside-diphosphate-sugar epimerase